MELAKRIYRMSPDQTQEFRNLIFDNTPEGIRTVVDPGLVFVFLYMRAFSNLYNYRWKRWYRSVFFRKTFIRKIVGFCSRHGIR